jgi:DNA polymerase I-like protein with 3'-5' exonuclease and polymerase domains
MAAERMAINMPLQGRRRRHHEAGHDRGRRRPPGPAGVARKLLLQVHDELVLEVAEG